MNLTRSHFLFLIFIFNSGLFASEEPRKSTALAIPGFTDNVQTESHSYESRNHSILNTTSNSREISPKTSSSTSPNRRESLDAAASAMMQALTDAAQKTTIKENRVELLKTVATRLQTIIIEEEVREREKTELRREKLIEEARIATPAALADIYYDFPSARETCSLKELKAIQLILSNKCVVDCP